MSRKIFLTFLIFTSVAQGSGSTGAEATKSKVEELFIWKMSDELSLIPGEEKKFSELVKNLNQKKSDLNSEMQTHLQDMIKAKTDGEKNKELVKYKKSLQAYNKLAEDELESVKALLGVKRLVKYLEVKQDMTNRLKSLLVNPDTPAKKNSSPLPTPQIIEE